MEKKKRNHLMLEVNHFIVQKHRFRDYFWRFTNYFRGIFVDEFSHRNSSVGLKQGRKLNFHIFNRPQSLEIQVF